MKMENITQMLFTSLETFTIKLDYLKANKQNIIEAVGEDKV